MKKFLSSLLSVLLILPLFALPSYAAENPGPITAELSSDTVARVKEEVLTGNITNHEDVLKVALAQYEAATKARTYSRSSMPIDEDAPLTITQLVDSTTDENGVTTDTLAATSLLVLDENGSPVSANSYFLYYKMTSTGGNNTYSVYATHTMYAVGMQNNPTFETDTIRVDRSTTVLTYGTSIGASSLQQFYADSCDVIDLDSTTDSSTVTYNPIAGRNYTFYPDSRYIPRYNLGYIQTSVRIIVGTSTIEIASILPLAGSWEFLPGFSEGW